MRNVFALLFFALAPMASSQRAPELQLRLPLHLQILSQADTGSKDRFGFAAWEIRPNIHAPADPLSTLIVAGLLWQHEKNNWVEFMVGSRLNQDGYIDPLLNVRLVNNQIRGVTVSGEIQQTFRKERRRFLGWIAVDKPLFWKILAGVESEKVISFAGGDSWSGGPRVVVPITSGLPSQIKISLIPAYHFREDKDFVRVYAVTNISFP